MRDLVQEQGLLGDIDDVLGPEDRFGHACEGREFVDHAAQIADLADDRAGQLGEGAVVILDQLAIAALQPFRRELDRGQRVLDFMRDAACDVGPGGTALVEQLAGDVVEGQDRAFLGARDLDRERPRFRAGADLDDRLALAAVDERSEFRRDRGERLADRAVVAGFEQDFRGTIDQPNPAVARDRDDASGNPGHHRFDQRAAAFQRAGLRLEAFRHGVERVRQHADLVIGGRIGHAGRKIALGDTLRRTDQFGDRANQPIGHGERDEHDDRDHQQRDQQQRDVEAQLDILRPHQQRAVIGINAPRLDHALRHLLRPTLSRGVEEQRRARHAGQRMGALGIGAGDARFARKHAANFVRVDILHRAAIGILDQRLAHDLAILADREQHRARQAALIDVLREGVLERQAVGRPFLLEQHALDIGRHGAVLIVDVAQQFRIGSLGELLRVFEHAAGMAREPEFGAILEQQRRDHGKQHRRHRRQHGEDRHQPHMELCAAAGARARGAALGDAPAEQDEQGDAGHQIGDEQQRDERRGQQRLRSGLAGNGEIARQGDDHRDRQDEQLDRGCDAEPALQSEQIGFGCRVGLHRAFHTTQ